MNELDGLVAVVTGGNSGIGQGMAEALAAAGAGVVVWGRNEETAKHLIARGAGGSLVAVSSTAAIHGPGNNAAYAASKTGVLGLVRSAAVGLARRQIRVNALTPGWTITEMSGPSYAHEGFRTVTVGRTPAGRWAAPAEMGPAAVYLANPAHTFHTGDNLVVDGGYTIF